MTHSVDLTVDVTEAAGLGEPAHLALTVTVPDSVGTEPVVYFAKPGAGYSRGYYTADLPGPPAGSGAGAGIGTGSQAEWHAARGAIFVSLDLLGVGDSSQHPDRLTFGPVVAAAQAAEADVLQKLAAGTLMNGLGKVENPLKIGIGQSMGGCLTVVQQGRYHGYDGVAVLGYGVLETLPPTAPGTPPLALPWIPRGALLHDGVITNAPALVRVDPAAGVAPGGLAWGFHYDDVDPDVVAQDMTDYPARGGELPAWGSATIPAPLVLWCVTPGAVLAEAAAIEAPVLLAMGERDVLTDPRGEVRAYRSSASVDLFVCPRMAHMHNFAGTRELLWRRIETWTEWVRACAAAVGVAAATAGSAGATAGSGE